jgi:trimeric autotransporter adhesin
MKIRKILLLLIVFTIIVNAQTGSINNTLGAGGSFTVKGPSGATYLVLDQATGKTTFFKNIELGNQLSSDPDVGVITKNGLRFLHNYTATNTFGENVYLGINAGSFITPVSASGTVSSYNVAVGNLSMNLNSRGYENTALGFSSLRNNTDGQQNVAIGTLSLNINTVGAFLTAVGYRSLYSNTTGNVNTAVGWRTLYSNTTGQYNTAVGGDALYSNTTQGGNTAVGYQSAYTNSTGYSNVSIGNQSLYLNTSGYENAAIGSSALRSNTTGYQNTALGYSSLFTNTGGNQNTAIGYYSMLTNSTGSFNTAIGFNSLRTNTNSSYNVAVGFNALTNSTTGTQNTAIGGYAGSSVSTGSNLTLIGYNALPSIANATNEITLGNNQITTLRCNVQTITSLSDARDKKNIKELSLGLNFLMKVKPREFNWDRREWYENGISDESKMSRRPTAGFIAQEFDSLQTTEHAEWLNLVLKDNPEKWEATYGNLLPIIVKAVQDLKKEKDELQNKYEKLLSFNQELSIKNEFLTKEINSIKTSISEEIDLQVKSILSKTQIQENENNKLTLSN